MTVPKYYVEVTPSPDSSSQTFVVDAETEDDARDWAENLYIENVMTFLHLDTSLEDAPDDVVADNEGFY